MFILDTNILKVWMRPDDSGPEARWVNARSGQRIYITTVSQAEVLAGLATMPLGRKRAALEAAASEMFAIDFAYRILPFDENAARAYAEVLAARQAAGRPIAALDAQIAGITLARDARLVTRNAKDFEGCGVREVIDPWQA
jgi:toxin FitB